MTLHLDLSSFSATEMKIMIVLCMTVFFALLLRAFEELKGTSAFHSFLLQKPNPSREEKSNLNRKIKTYLIEAFKSLVISLALYGVYEIAFAIF